MHKSFTYINAGLLAAGLALLGYASFTVTPASLASNANSMLAAVGVGVSASVPPNEYNTLAEQLSAKEAELNREQAALNSSGYASGKGGLASVAQDRLGFYSLCISTLLFILVAVNFYYDVRRNSRQNSAGAFSVDLR